MQFFADTAEIEDIKKLHAMGLLDGITTNPSLIAKSGRQFKEVIKEICGVVPGPVSAEVASVDYDTMMQEAHVLAKLADNVVVKVPLTVDGLKATRELAIRGCQINVTLCFSAAQALLAAKAGATYISPFIGRLDDQGADGMELIREIRAIYDNYDFDTEILAASIRTPAHVRDAAIAGADCATIPTDVFKALFKHPLTERGLEQFMSDWAKTGQSIL